MTASSEFESCHIALSSRICAPCSGSARSHPVCSVHVVRSAASRVDVKDAGGDDDDEEEED